MVRNFFPLLICLFVFSGFLAIQVAADYWRAQVSINFRNIAAEKKDLYKKNFKMVKGLDHDGKMIDLSKIKAPVVILNFWADWCVPCLEEFPSLVKLRKRYREDQVYILGISESGDQKKVRSVYKKYWLNFPSILGGEKWIESYNVKNFPFSVMYLKNEVIALEGKKDFLSQKLLNKIDKFLPQK